VRFVCFNPLPAFRLGDANYATNGRFSTFVSIHSQLLGWEMLIGVWVAFQVIFVSIHSQLLGWEMPVYDCLQALDTVVSIHSQLLGWEMHASRAGFKRNFFGFNPLPAFRLGDASAQGGAFGPLKCFNPLPAFRLGDARSNKDSVRITGVSIHSQLLGWEMLGLQHQGDCLWQCFNPLPAFRLGDANARDVCIS